ncbi:hypothetical protein PVK06_012331 [Gossypium arboreum]|uniref:Retrovirus-related Pol polyprotein from transposon TNT 1-94 n=1 Tax=Gossypium arboreum TaxID=29729 RepID=A0ABR0QBY4_GOSAR|nr:hypothetical protein PVK06_012331 [Gossypium arboreum]
MAADTVSGNDGDSHHSVHTITPITGSSPDLGCGLLSKVQPFPKHDTVKLGQHNFLLWKQQILLILEGYGLHDFVLRTISVPPQSLVDSHGDIVPNPAFLVHKQQDKLLASWLLSPICDDILMHLTTAHSSFDVWSMVTRRLSIEYKSIRVVASAMSVSLDLLADLLAGCEARQQDSVSSMPLQVNVAHQSNSDDRNIGPIKNTEQPERGSRPPFRGNSSRSFRGRGRGRRFAHNKPQCQLCGRVGHTVQKCYYRFNELFEGVSDQPMQVHCHHFSDVSNSSCGGSHCCSHQTSGL